MVARLKVPCAGVRVHMREFLVFPAQPWLLACPRAHRLPPLEALSCPPAAPPDSGLASWGLVHCPLPWDLHCGADDWGFVGDPMDESPSRNVLNGQKLPRSHQALGTHRSPGHRAKALVVGNLGNTLSKDSERRMEKKMKGKQTRSSEGSCRGHRDKVLDVF